MEPQNPEMHDTLAEFGHFYLMLESHEAAARHCRQQLERLRGRLMELQQSTPMEMPG